MSTNNHNEAEFSDQRRDTRSKAKAIRITTKALKKLKRTRVAIERFAKRAKPVIKELLAIRERILAIDWTDSDLSEAGARRISAQGLFILLLIAAFGIDYIVSANFVSFSLSAMGLGSFVWLLIGKALFPAFFIIVEMTTSLRIVTASEEGEEKARKRWIIFGCLIATVMAALAVSSFISGVGSSLFELTVSEILVVCALSIMTFGAHVLIVFGGRIAADSKARFYLRWLERKEDRLSEDHDELAYSAFVGFQEHLMWAKEGGLPTQIPLFSHHARQLIEKGAGNSIDFIGLADAASTHGTRGFLDNRS